MTHDLTHQRWHHRLSELHDGDLAPSDAAACRAHVAVCGRCQADLEAVTQVRAVLQSHAVAAVQLPPEAVWHGISTTIAAAPRPPARRASWLLAAAVACLGFGALLAREIRLSRIPADTATGLATADAVSSTVTTSLGDDASIAELRRLLADEGDRISPTTSRALQEALAIIDAAVADAERAIAADSSNVYVQQHLARTRTRRLTLLREAARLVQS